MTLSTHVLDTTTGTPASGMACRLSKGNLTIFAGVTDSDGRCPDLLVLPIGTGLFSLSFSIAAYFKALGVAQADPPFLDIVTIDFGIADASAHYHVPLLVSPFAYSTYRGS